MMGIKELVKPVGILFWLSGNLCFTAPVSAQDQSRDIESIKLKISFGHTAPAQTARTVQLISASPGLTVAVPTGKGIEKNDRVAATSLLYCGAGDVDELIADIHWPRPVAPLRKVAKHESSYAVNGEAMWGYLMQEGSPGQGARLREDPWKQPDAPILTVQLNAAGTQGFSVGLEQLLRHGAMWLPEQDVYITLAGKPIGFKQHLASLKGQRILDGVRNAPDASLEQFKKSWEDFGNPIVWNKPWETSWMGTKGHLTVTTATHGSVYKFAVDRWGNVRPDFASPHKFRMDLLWEGSQWKGQKIVDGLPVLITNLEKNKQLCEIEQLAAAPGDLPAGLRGELPGVMFTKVRISGKAGPISFGLRLNNELKEHGIAVKKNKNNWTVADQQTGDTWLILETGNGLSVKIAPPAQDKNGQQVVLTVEAELPEGATREFLVKLPSPAVAPADAARLNALDFATAKKSTVSYWENWISQGAHFRVPEAAVNDLFRANLWHALILPRHTLDSLGRPHMDLPYANTAYGQKNADWPVNQSVYVDYMIYGLRGYEKVAEDEMAAMFQSQQQPDGRIAGFANWGVYSPAHLYTIAQNFLLSRNREEFERLLPNSLKTLDWCLARIDSANRGAGSTGLILGPLNDLTHAEREWAFTQAYFAGGLELFGEALSAYRHPRAEEVLRAAAKMKSDVVKEFARSSVKSPIVQLADGTWINYVPTDAMTPRRMLDEWYPSDVDCGPLHLSRLGVIDPESWLTTAMLHDHEDNLFLSNLGAANEPIYVQQATAYLLRDEPKAAIRAFYSLMACGFSHEQLTPLEHRWAWGQYYGPPSTDGAWFELYRKMLLNEFGLDTLLIGQAIPRAWLEKGKQVEVKNAPTYFGPVSFTMEGLTAENKLNAVVELSARNLPKELLIRFRHPLNKPITAVMVNGQPWKDYDVKKEYIRITKPVGGKYVISAKY
ncbi:hypothetical protein [Chitinophaga sp. MM2321]|uniref:hypothetical protein n=1 Tax=Chitinophaga sp. MM2321 TaxID=3137178 RepID=UPI0032D5A8DB